MSEGINRVLAKAAIDRERPYIMKKLHFVPSGSRPTEETVDRFREAQSRLESQTFETVKIESYDGTELVGHLYRAEHQQRVLLAMHGWRSSWSMDFSMISPFWEKNGCSVLYVEQRGQGLSAGEYMGFGLTERFDCIEWMKWLNANGFAEVPMYLVGLSMGAATVLMAAGSEELTDNVRGVIADCGFTSTKDIWEHVIEKNCKLPYRLHENGIKRLYKDRIHFDSDDYSTIEAMKVTKKPILLIHGSDDHFVPVQMSKDNYEACQAPKKLLIVEGADHGMSYLVDREAYEKAVLDFFAAYDGTNGQEENACLN